MTRSNHPSTTGTDALEQLISDLTAERDQWKTEAELLKRQLENEQEHVKALLTSLTRAEQSGSAAFVRDDSERSKQDDEGTLREYFDPEADALDQLLGRDKSGSSNPQSISGAIARFKRWIS